MSVPDVWTTNPVMYQKLQDFLASGKFYEAQQVYMTQVNRASLAGVREGAKTAAPTTGALLEGNFVPKYTLTPSSAKALALLEDATATMFNAPATTPANVDPAYVSSRILAAKELCGLFISTLEKINAKATPSLLTRLASLIGSIPTLAASLAKTLGTTVDHEVLRDAAYSVCKQGIKWSIVVPMAVDEGDEPAPATFPPMFHRHGAPQLHQLAADIQGDAPTLESIYHWCRARNGLKHITALLPHIRESDEVYYACVALQIVLDYLCVEDLKSAVVVSKGLGTRPVENEEAQVMLDFMEIAVKAVQRDGAGSIYQSAQQQCRRVLAAQDEKMRLVELSQEVGYVWFDLPAPVSLMDQVLGMASGMMGMFKQ